MMVRDTLAGTTVEPSQNHTALSQNQEGTQQLPGETLENLEQQNRVLEQQNQLLKLENLDLLGQQNELLEQETPVQTSTDNQTRPPDQTSCGGPLHPWWPQQSSFRAAIPLPWPSPGSCLLPIPLPCLRPDPIPDPWATHLRTFSSQQEYVLVLRTHRQLLHSGYYWGPMGMEEAHNTLLLTPPGSFLIRDSRQLDVFFTLSYHGDQGPTSVRVLLTNQSFRLNGSIKAFDSLFALLRSYMESSHRRLRRAWRRERPMTLQQLCRGRVIEMYGAERIDSLPGINQVVAQYLRDYPYTI
ncbi:hypothetical protein J4Q44_G00292530 [Coregonus suidteri]|uniref:Suppressor of cytokine signaling 1-like n=1 Tax=Coregonus suidteri TaxID=861788 RepID=A0AAN8L4H2_9TELE